MSNDNIANLVYHYDPEPAVAPTIDDGVTEAWLYLWSPETGEVHGHAPVALVTLDGHGFITAR